MTSTPDNAGTRLEATAVAREVIASFGQDPALYVPGTVSTLPGTRTTTYVMACSPECPHRDGTCHVSHAAYVSDDRLRARLVPAQRRGA